MKFGTMGADREIKVLQTLKRHSNVVTFHRAYKKSGKLYLFLEMCDQGNLSEFIERRKKRNEETNQYILSNSEA